MTEEPQTRPGEVAGWPKLAWVDKFYAGGSRYLRGYQWSRFTGDRLLSGTVEYRNLFLPDLLGLFGLKDLPAVGIAWEVYLDGGRVWEATGGVQPLSDLRFGGGTGLIMTVNKAPLGRLELNAKSADGARSAWAGAATRDFTDVDVAAVDASLTERLSWQTRRVDLPAGRYETLLPPTAVADMLTYMYWSAGARDAGEGRTVFSRPGGGTRIGERLSLQPLDLFSDPSYPGLECTPSWWPTRPAATLPSSTTAWRRRAPTGSSQAP